MGVRFGPQGRGRVVALKGEVLVFAIAASRLRPLGGYGVFALFEGLRIGTLTALREASGRGTAANPLGTVFEYADGTLIVIYGCVVMWVSMSARV